MERVGPQVSLCPPEQNSGISNTKRTRRTRKKAAHGVDKRMLSSEPSQICLQLFRPMRSENAFLQSSILDPELRQGRYRAVLCPCRKNEGTVPDAILDQYYCYRGQRRQMSSKDRHEDRSEELVRRAFFQLRHLVHSALLFLSFLYLEVASH